MTYFPEALEIRVIDSKDKEPIEGIVLFIRLFANRKNDYYALTNPSDKNGLIQVTKGMLKEIIDHDLNFFGMDYFSDLQDCKPYIGIMAEEWICIMERIKAVKRYIAFDKYMLEKYKLLINCNNKVIASRKEFVDLEQGADKQKITFKVVLIGSNKNRSN